MKICSKCKAEKDEKEFYLDCQCKECRKKYMRSDEVRAKNREIYHKKYSQNKEAYRKKSKEYYYRTKERRRKQLRNYSNKTTKKDVEQLRDHYMKHLLASEMKISEKDLNNLPKSILTELIEAYRLVLMVKRKIKGEIYERL